MAILVTGAAGFIGSETSRALLVRGEEVVGIDNLNDYYDPALKRARIERIGHEFGTAFKFEKLDFAEEDKLAKLARDHDIDRIIHLGAQADVGLGSSSSMDSFAS